MTDKKLLGAVFAVTGGICWGFSGCCGQYLFTNNEVDSKWLTVVRMLASGAALLVFCMFRYRAEMKAMLHDRRDVIRVVLYSVFGLMLCQYSYLTAIEYTNAATATVIQYTGPVMVVAVVCALERRLPRLYELLCIVLAVGGTFLIATHGNIHTLQISGAGLFWCIIAAISLVCYTMLLGDTVNRRPVLVCNAIGFTLGGAVLAVIVGFWRYSVSLDLAGVLAVAGIVFFGTIVGYSLYMQGVAYIGPAKASMISTIETVSSAVIAHFWLGTQFAPADLIGFVFIVSTVFILARQRKADGGKDEAHSGNAE